MQQVLGPISKILYGDGGINQISVEVLNQFGDDEDNRNQKDPGDLVLRDTEVMLVVTAHKHMSLPIR